MLRLREEALRRLAVKPEFDVLIIGGGVNGVAVQRELALNGVSALLVDQGDFCKGATGASSRMAHGGLRYLENREFKLVAESARERNLLLKYAPHFTKPLEIVVPLSGYIRGLAGSILRFLGFKAANGPLSAASLKGALFLYEFLGRIEKVLPDHRVSLSRRGFPKSIAARYKVIISYFDARIRNPEALVLEMIADAMQAHANTVCLNHVDWHYDIDGSVVLSDPITGQTASIKPRIIVNATGAWVDVVNDLLHLKTQYIRPVKGAHVLLRHDELHQRMAGRAFYFDDGTGRMVICYPLDKTILLGTTEIQIKSPDDSSVAPSEVSYLLQALSDLFDDIDITNDHVVALTSGIRPLQAGGSGSANQANRDHRIACDELNAGTLLLSLIGGKWTTFRAFGEQAANLILERLRVSRTVATRDRVYLGAVGLTGDETATNKLAACIADKFGLPEKRAADLVSRYGAIASSVADFCSEDVDEKLAGVPDYSKRELRWLVEFRAALFLDDILLRRTQLVLEGRCNRNVVREIGHALAHIRGLDQQWAEEEIARCLAMPTIIPR
ncbi:glycerol-3-phosphate dehydrogenase/oxidase [Brucella sp. TWI559]